jgi:hypothetical protein
MANSNHTARLSIEALNQLATRLFDHADAITNSAARNVESDMRLAARVAFDMANWRFAVAQAASTCKDESTAHQLRELLGKG